EDTPAPPGWGSEVMDEEGGRRALAEGLGQIRKLPAGFGHRLLEIDAVGSVVAVEVGHQILPLHGEEDCVGMECVEPTFWVQDVLAELTKSCLIEFDAQSLGETERNKKIVHELDRQRRKQSHAQWCEGYMLGGGLLHGVPDKAYRSYRRIQAQQAPSGAHRPVRVSGLETTEECLAGLV